MDSVIFKTENNIAQYFNLCSLIKFKKVERYVVKFAGIHDKTTIRGPHAFNLTTCSIKKNVICMNLK